ncbi:hypothetical protein GCK32_017968 [Trichostrongylus colubriformis]|uniref:Uncharacterized protein n=1 Tax=Trichostrongylus colubriformis TaxID=6319 RepID=A0AAN8G4T5_TRICO
MDPNQAALSRIARMSPMYTLLLLCALSALCISLPYRFSRRLPSSLITRIANPFDDEDDVIAMVPLARARRSQPIVDYTDEFSADPFEMQLGRGRKPL